MQTLKGSVSKIKVLKLSQSPLIRFSLGEVSCLIAKHSLNFLYQVHDDCQLVVCGSYNSRKQFIVSKFCVVNLSEVNV